ncbi:hypothetical protein C2G38_2168068 [Gigaspora rosea]|uniref:Uncharacterized protein n=1 Tax=Gigaspora rosea TaxID=44941 RepID=A0A397VRT8_9GLOM|nr:hypothetical protein C2G38_2168068 [Gigaspora rosea]
MEEDFGIINSPPRIILTPKSPSRNTEPFSIGNNEAYEAEIASWDDINNAKGTIEILGGYNPFVRDKKKTEMHSIRITIAILCFTEKYAAIIVVTFW